MIRTACCSFCRSNDVHFSTMMIVCSLFFRVVLRGCHQVVEGGERNLFTELHGCMLRRALISVDVQVLALSLNQLADDGFH